MTDLGQARAAVELSGARAWLLTAVRCLLGGLFVFAAVAKILAPYDFAEVMASYRILHEDVVFDASLVIVWQELFCGALLLLGFYTRAAAVIGSGMLAIFSLALLSAYARGLQMDCGCFGPLVESSISLGSLARTLALTALSVLLACKGGGRWCLENAVLREAS